MSDRPRRAVLSSVPMLLGAFAGCQSLMRPRLAHTVSVYNGDGASREVTVVVRNAADETLYERTYHFDQRDSADEDGTFPASADPETVSVTFDGTERTFEWPTTDCNEATRSGVEVNVFFKKDEPVWVSGNCQTVELDE